MGGLRERSGVFRRWWEGVFGRFSGGVNGLSFFAKASYLCDYSGYEYPGENGDEQSFGEVFAEGVDAVEEPYPQCDGEEVADEYGRECYPCPHADEVSDDGAYERPRTPEGEDDEDHEPDDAEGFEAALVAICGFADADEGGTQYAPFDGAAVSGEDRGVKEKKNKDVFEAALEVDEQGREAEVEAV